MTNQQTSTPVNNPFAVSVASTQAVQTAVASARAAQEVQAAMVVAKKFPRDQAAAFNRILQACRRKNLAEAAIYTYPRGDTKVEGPTIRLAESIAQNWGNIDFGIVELEQRDGESTVMAFAWDLETNTRQTKVFTVKHERWTKKQVYPLEDPRDIYEVTANQGARRLRSCILGIVPGDIVDAAVDECNRTLAGSTQEPLGDRVRKMITAFADMGVTIAMIEKRLNHRHDSINDAELIALRKIYTAIKDGMGSRDSYFEPVIITEAEPGQVPSQQPQRGPLPGSPGPAAPAQRRRRVQPPGVIPMPAQPTAPPQAPVESGTPPQNEQPFQHERPEKDETGPEGTPEPTEQPGSDDSPPAPPEEQESTTEIQRQAPSPLAPTSTTPDGYVKTLRDAMVEAGITEKAVMQFCRDSNLAKPNQTSINLLSTAKLASLCLCWPDVVKGARATK
jgi:hypothetical protein